MAARSIVTASRLARRGISPGPRRAARGSLRVAAGAGQRREPALGREPDHLDDVVEHRAVAADERDDAEIDVRRHAGVQLDLAFAVCSTSLDGGEIEEREPRRASSACRPDHLGTQGAKCASPRVSMGSPGRRRSSKSKSAARASSTSSRIAQMTSAGAGANDRRRSGPSPLPARCCQRRCWWRWNIDRNGLEVLDRDECLQLLSGLGPRPRAVSVGALPVILPVNFLLDGEPHPHPHRARHQARRPRSQDAVVAFEVDHIDPFSHGGWSVCVTGHGSGGEGRGGARRVEGAPAAALDAERVGHVMAVSIETSSAGVASHDP